MIIFVNILLARQATDQQRNLYGAAADGCSQHHADRTGGRAEIRPTQGCYFEVQITDRSPDTRRPAGRRNALLFTREMHFDFQPRDSDAMK